MANFAPIVDKTFKFEGGYQVFPNDSANYYNGKLIGTNRGISAMAYGDYLKREPSVAEVKAITPEVAKAVYKKLFWDKMKGDLFENQSVAHLVFDFLIASGFSKESDVMRSVNTVAGKKVVAEIDNGFTTEEVKILNGLDQEKFFNDLKSYRLKFVDNLIASNPTKYGMFEKGWKKRINELVFVDEKKNL